MTTAPPGTPEVRGTTRLFAVLGDPVEQVRAPALLNPLFVRLGVDAVLVPVHAAPADLPRVLSGLDGIRNLDGLLVTVPHKFAALGFAGSATPAARLSGSTNALRREPDGRWLADNFDGAGFVAGLTAAGHSPVGRRVALVGAGGAGSALAVALLDAGVSHLSVHDLDERRLDGLCGRLSAHWPGRISGSPVADLATAEIAVNATPLGMAPGDPLPFDPAALRPGSVVAEIIMKPAETPLLAAAAALGHRVHHGHHTLDHQLALYRSFFRL
ncbi:shikimate dehydrogenase [Kitasatospora sp. NPDC036755]|uniref:shikimate dehydrogenase family protein n=1 Tax=Kitasatospora sp. NPDC036755 TaxID=3154600 RepID=UPI0033CF3EF9